MRKTLLLLLLTSSSVPAFAADESDDRAARREAMRAERAEARAERQAERSQQSIQVAPPAESPAIERRSAEPAPAREIRREMIGNRDADRAVPRELRREVIERPMLERSPPRMVEVESVRPALERRREAVEQRVRPSRGPRLVEVEADGPALDAPKAVDTVREWRRSERGSGRSPALVEQRTDTGWEPLRKRTEQGVEGVTGIRREPIVGRVPREGTQPPIHAVADRSKTTTHHWRGDWRSDHRYDWKRHRNRHRSLFRLGFYFDPFGWSYYRWPIGWRLWPSFYRSSFWLHDPWMYRLPPAYGPYRWVRYWDDALLVNIHTGQVVDVIHNFFW